MASPATERAKVRKAAMAADLRAMKSYIVTYPNGTRTIEIAARLLEQTSVGRFNAAIRSLNADEGRYQRKEAAPCS